MTIIPKNAVRYYIQRRQIFNGAGNRNRTHNLLITNQLLCQLSYASEITYLSIKENYTFVKSSLYKSKVFSLHVKIPVGKACQQNAIYSKAGQIIFLQKAQEPQYRSIGYHKGYHKANRQHLQISTRKMIKVFQ